MIPDPSSPYDVSIAGGARRDILRLLKRAANLGLDEEITRLLLEIEDALRDEPRTWGDPIRNLRQLQAIYYRRMYHPLIVHYSVHDSRPFVVLARVIPEPGHELSKGG